MIHHLGAPRRSAPPAPTDRTPAGIGSVGAFAAVREPAGAGAAAAAGIPFTLSTLGTTSIENVRLIAKTGGKSGDWVREGAEQ